MDFDLGRNTGGEDKIKYVVDQLKEIDNLAKDDEQYLLNNNNSFKDRLLKLNSKRVFFSYPIDIDYLMLDNYYSDYTAENDILGKPVFPKTGDSDFDEANCNVVYSVFKKHKVKPKLDTFPKELNVTKNFDKYYWYRHLFLGVGKPVTHKIVFQNIEERIINNNEQIKVLTDLLDCIKEFIDG